MEVMLFSMSLEKATLLVPKRFSSDIQIREFPLSEKVGAVLVSLQIFGVMGLLKIMWILVIQMRFRGVLAQITTILVRDMGIVAQSITTQEQGQEFTVSL